MDSVQRQLPREKANINKYRLDTHNHLSALATLTVNQLQTDADDMLSVLQRLLTTPQLGQKQEHVGTRTDTGIFPRQPFLSLALNLDYPLSEKGELP